MLRKTLSEVRQLLSKRDDFTFHFAELKHEQRVPLIHCISRAPIKSVSVLIHKPTVKNLDDLRSDNQFYWHASRLVLERVSWLCRDRLRKKGSALPGDGYARVQFSNKTGMEYGGLRDHLTKLKEQDTTIEWSVIREKEITSQVHRNSMGLQIADAVASGFWNALNKNRYGFSEDRFARMLKPIVYDHNGQYHSYGLRFYPKPNTLDYEWINEYQQ